MELDQCWWLADPISCDLTGKLKLGMVCIAVCYDLIEAAIVNVVAATCNAICLCLLDAKLTT